MNYQNKLITGLIIILLVIVGVVVFKKNNESVNKKQLVENYNPQVDPSDFNSNINNPYLSLPIGKKMVFEAQKEDGLERIELFVPGWTKTIMGVETLVFWDKVYVNDQLVEDTRDYLAQHKNGDVWYFGENVDNYEAGKLKDHEGAWIAGIDGAKPGIWMLNNPQVGDEYRQEYYAGKAEDMAKVIAVDETVTVPYGTFTGCIKTLEWSPLFSATGNKYDCKEINGRVLEVDLPGPNRAVEERVSLISVDLNGALHIKLPTAYVKEGVVDSNFSL